MSGNCGLPFFIPLNNLLRKKVIYKTWGFLYVGFPAAVLCSHEQLDGGYSWMTKTAKKFFWYTSEKWIKEAES